MRGRVRRRVTWIVTLSSLLPLLLVAAITLGIVFNTQRRLAQQQQSALTQLIANDFSDNIASSQNELSVLGDTLIRTVEIEGINDTQLTSLVLSGATFSEVGFYDAAGRRLAAAARFGPVTMPQSVAGTPLFDLVRTGQVFFADPAPLAVRALPLSPSEVPRLRIAVPIQISFEERLTLVGDIPMDQLWAATTRMESATGTRVLVLARDGLLISASATQLLIDQPPLRQIPLVQEKLPLAIYQSPLGDEVLGTQALITPPGWTVVVERPISVLYGDVQRLALTLLAVTLAALPLVAGVGWLAGRGIAQPIQQLHHGVETFTSNPREYQPVTIATGDELTALGDSFNRMVGVLRESQDRLLNANEELETLVAQRTTELQHALEEVRAQNLTQEALLETVRRLGMPVIPIRRGMLVMPLVGEFDASRVSEIGDHLLAAIEREHARVVLIDITGVPVVDQLVASALVQTSTAARLLGTEVILAGIRPDIAEALISLGIDLSDLRTAATLDQAFQIGSADLKTTRSGRRPALI
jgi:anti-anti-sigma regulatory factor/methyl-accepting chemotaxis protein